MTDHEIRFFADDAAVRHVGEGLLARSLPKAEWTHEAHLAACLWLLTERPDIHIERELPAIISGYNEAVGGVNDATQGYHHTITLTYVAGVRDFLSRVPADRSLAGCVNALLSAPEGRRDWPLRHYSRDTLFSVEARLGYVPPDLHGPDNREQMEAMESQRYWSDGCLHLPHLFPRDMLAMFYQQMHSDLVGEHGSLRNFTARGPLISKDAIEVYSMQYAPMRAFLWGLTPMIAATVERTLLPTYAYLRIYQQGDICRVHTDRRACEHSLSLTIAYGENRPWALSVGTDRIDEPKQVAVDDFEGAPFISMPMAVGDSVLYQGVHHRHGRLDPNPNSWSAHLFLHWIDANGRYCDEAFDRPTIERARSQRAG